MHVTIDSYNFVHRALDILSVTDGGDRGGRGERSRRRSHACVESRVAAIESDSHIRHVDRHKECHVEQISRIDQRSATDRDGSRSPASFRSIWKPAVAPRFTIRFETIMCIWLSPWRLLLINFTQRRGLSKTSVRRHTRNIILASRFVQTNSIYHYATMEEWLWSILGDSHRNQKLSKRNKVQIICLHRLQRVRNVYFLRVCIQGNENWSRSSTWNAHCVQSNSKTFATMEASR